MTLQSIAGYDAHNADYYRGHLGPGHQRLRHHPAGPGDGPELHVRARPELRARQADRLERHARPRSRRPRRALAAAGAILVERPVITRPASPAASSTTRRTATSTLLPPPRAGRADQVAGRGDRRQPGQRARGAEVRQRHARGRAGDRHQPATRRRRSPTATTCCRARASATGHRPDDGQRHAPTRATTSSRSSAASPTAPRAGYPQLTIPMGYNATQRRTLNVSIHANAYKERDLIGVAYVIEQAHEAAQAGQRRSTRACTAARRRCRRRAFAERGSCNPDYESTMKLVGGARRRCRSRWRRSRRSRCRTG